MKKILVKEIKSNNKLYYLIYFKIDDKNMECEFTTNKEDKNLVVNELILKHFENYSKEDILNSIEEITKN
jgi:hypothetical protein